MSTNLHLIFMGIAGLAFLVTIVGAALGFWHIAPSATARSQMLIRFGMALSAAACIATVISSVALGAKWYDRVHWEIAADAGFAVLALGLLIGPVERRFLQHRAAVKRGRERYSERYSD